MKMKMMTMMLRIVSLLTPPKHPVLLSHFFTHRPTPLRLIDEPTTPFEKTTLFTRRMSPTTIFTDDADS